jgi:hypothetical protein
MDARRAILRKTLVGAGAALLVGMMVLAAFSLGVYVGHQGLLVGTLDNFGARAVADQPAAVQQPSGPAQELPAATPALVGKVGAITNEGLFVRTIGGLRLVEVGEETRIRNGRGQTLSMSDLRPGANVVVYGEFSEDGRTLLANVIVSVPAAQP